MANPSVLQVATKLYSPSEPEGRVFQAGEPWPGDVWSAKPGGEPVGANAAAGALKDLIDANDRLDQQGQMLASKDHDLAVMASERDAALGKVAGLEQDAIAAKKAQADAEELARSYMAERDSARAELEAAGARVADLVEQLSEAEAAKTTTAADLAAANDTIAKLTTDLEAATAPPATDTKKAKPAAEPEAA